MGARHTCPHSSINYGTNFEVLEYWGIMDAESWSSPAIGYFTDDDVPDVFTHYVIGAFPMYTGSTSVLVDGATGQVLWIEDTEHTSFTSPLAVDLDGDSRDEILMIRGVGELFSGNEAYIFHNQATILNSSDRHGRTDSIHENHPWRDSILKGR